MRAATLLAAGLGLVAAGCGSSGLQAAGRTTTAAPAATSTPAPGGLQAEAAAAATGDVPDNQVFVAYTGARFSIRYPEGWAQTGNGDRVTFRDKNNIVRIAIAPAPAPTVAAAKAELAAAGVSVHSAPQETTVSGKPAVRAVYSTTSAQNPVTGKRVTLLVDRYELAHGGVRAVVDLGTPEGVDNVDAFRLMIDSFRWR